MDTASKQLDFLFPVENRREFGHSTSSRGVRVFERNGSQFMSTTSCRLHGHLVARMQGLRCHQLSVDAVHRSRGRVDSKGRVMRYVHAVCSALVLLGTSSYSAGTASGGASGNALVSGRTGDHMNELIPHPQSPSALPSLPSSSSYSVAPPPMTTATVTVDLQGTLTPFPHTWKRIFGAGHAALGLRADFQSQLRRAVRELGLGGVRQHGLFDDDMGPVVVGPRQ